MAHKMWMACLECGRVEPLHDFLSPERYQRPPGRLRLVTGDEECTHGEGYRPYADSAREAVQMLEALEA